MVAPKVFGLGQIGRALQENRELPDLADVIALGMLAELPDRHVFDHAAAQRIDGFSAHRGLLSGTGVDPTIFRQAANDRYRDLQQTSPTLPRERFSSLALSDLDWP